MNFFLKGELIGFLMAAPVGPVGILCIRRSLTNGQLSGFFSGLGAATADAFYGTIAAFGVTFASTFLTQKQTLFQLLGVIFLLYYGTRTFFENTISDGPQLPHRNLTRDYFSTFILTISNPLTIFSFAAVFAGLGLTHACGNYVQASFLVAGVFCGSALWWLLLSSVVGLYHKKITAYAAHVINQISGSIIISFGLAILAHVLWRLFVI